MGNQVPVQSDTPWNLIYWHSLKMILGKTLRLYGAINWQMLGTLTIITNNSLSYTMVKHSVHVTSPLIKLFCYQLHGSSGVSISLNCYPWEEWKTIRATQDPDIQDIIQHFLLIIYTETQKWWLLPHLHNCCSSKNQAIWLLQHVHTGGQENLAQSCLQHSFFGSCNTATVYKYPLVGNEIPNAVSIKKKRLPDHSS